jgi:NADPH:quinone reductase-like Zn-dependent oxidoreductase
MRAVVYTEHGGPDVLHVAEVEEPHAGAGQVRVAVRAAGVNPVDWKARAGMFPGDLPAIDGREAAGVVDEVGEGVDGVSAGDEVFGFGIGGAAAEYVLMADFARKPAGASWEEAAGLPVAVETSVRVFKVLGGLSAGQTIVIEGPRRAGDRHRQRAQPRVPALARRRADHLRAGLGRAGPRDRP